MLALVSSITTAVNGCDSFENSDTSAGLPLSRIVKVRLLEVRDQPAARVDHRRVDRHGADVRLEDRLVLSGQHERAGEQSDRDNGTRTS